MLYKNEPPKSYNYKGLDIFPRLDLLSSYKIIGHSSKPVVRETENCIFCDRPLAGNNKTHSHLIPELFGKNDSINKFECDCCNTQSGKWETSLGTFLTPIRIMSKIKAKNGKIPKFKSRLDGHERVTEIYMDNSGSLKGVLGTADDFIIESNGTGKLKFRIGNCNPFNIYKVYLKIALSLMPDNKLNKEAWMIKYLFADSVDNHLFPYIYQVFLDDKIMAESVFELRQLYVQHKYHPQYLLTAYFGKSIIHIVLPIKKPKKKIYINMPPVTEILSSRENYDVEKIDLSDTFNKRWDMTFNVTTTKSNLNLTQKSGLSD